MMDELFLEDDTNSNEITINQDLFPGINRRNRQKGVSGFFFLNCAKVFILECQPFITDHHFSLKEKSCSLYMYLRREV